MIGHDHKLRHPGCHANRDPMYLSAGTMFAASGNGSRLTGVAGMTMGREGASNPSFDRLRMRSADILRTYPDPEPCEATHVSSKFNIARNKEQNYYDHTQSETGI